MTQCLPNLRACLTAQEEEEEEEEDEGSPAKKRGRPPKGSEKPPEEDRACPNAGCGKGFRKYTALVKHMRGCLAEIAAKELLRSSSSLSSPWTCWKPRCVMIE